MCTDSHRSDLLAVAAVMAATAAVYLRVVSAPFLNFDDDLYVTEHTIVRNGLSLAGLKWALVSVHHATWHPLTTLAHMLDCSLFGLNPAGHHAVNVVWHVLNTGLLFWVLSRMTGARWRSLLVAGLFGLHPLHVESVAWVAERKDVLSTFFWLLSMWAYWLYVRAPRPWAYARIALAFSLALLAKPMVVTLPVVLLLLDFWPLRRWQGWQGAAPRTLRGAKPRRAGGVAAGVASLPLRRLVFEKLPLLALSLLVSGLTMWAQGSAQAMIPLADLGFGLRLANAARSTLWYMEKTLWPSGLAVYYPYEHDPFALAVAGALAAALLVLLTVGAMWTVRQRPYLLVGWLWYLTTLLPVIGIIQVGSQARADRYTYIPLIGVSIALAWGAQEISARWSWGVRYGRACVVAVLALCAAATWVQLGFWRDSEALFRRALAVTEGNSVAHHQLGKALAVQGRRVEAVEQFGAAVSLLQQTHQSRFELGLVLADMGNFEAAVVEYRAYLGTRPSARARYNLGNALVRLQRFAEAVPEYEEALRLQPDWPEARHNLGIALASSGRFAEALVQYSEALRHSPGFAEVYISRGLVLEEQQQLDAAIAAYRTAVQLRPAARGRAPLPRHGPRPPG